jgi:hypothetical protein
VGLLEEITLGLLVHRAVVASYAQISVSHEGLKRGYCLYRWIDAVFTEPLSSELRVSWEKYLMVLSLEYPQF